MYDVRPRTIPVLVVGFQSSDRRTSINICAGKRFVPLRPREGTVAESDVETVSRILGSGRPDPVCTESAKVAVVRDPKDYRSLPADWSYARVRDEATGARRLGGIS